MGHFANEIHSMPATSSKNKRKKTTVGVAPGVVPGAPSLSASNSVMLPGVSPGVNSMDLLGTTDAGFEQFEQNVLSGFEDFAAFAGGPVTGEEPPAKMMRTDAGPVGVANPTDAPKG